MGCVLITGAAGGIGSALVEAFAGAGHSVIGTDLVPRPEGLACEHYVGCDLVRLVDEPDYAEQVFAEVRSVLAGRPLHALVNNAAVQVLGPVEALGRDAWRRTLDVNLLAPFLWAQALLAPLEAAGGSILNISSIHARLTKPNFVAYATSKAALSGMTRAMAVELGARVRVNAIEPAAIGTPMLREGFAGDPAALGRLAGCHPSGRIGSTSEVARLAVAIAGAGSPFLNGAVIGLDGGIAAVLHDPA